MWQIFHDMQIHLDFVLAAHWFPLASQAVKPELRIHLKNGDAVISQIFQSYFKRSFNFFYPKHVFFFKDIFFLLIWNWYSRISFRFPDSRFSSGDFRQVGKNYGRENNKIFGGKLRQGTILAIFFLDSMPQLLAFGDGTLW